MMLKAERFLVTPQPLVTIGISPKSFGYFYLNDLEEKGNEFLKNMPDSKTKQRLAKIILPGTDMNTSWLLAMETIRKNFGCERNIRIGYDRYRLLQIAAVFRKCLLDAPNAKPERQELWQKMFTREKLLYGFAFSFMSQLSAWFPAKLRMLLTKMIMASLRTYRWTRLQRVSGSYKTILDVFELANPTTLTTGRIQKFLRGFF